MKDWMFPVIVSLMVFTSGTICGYAICSIQKHHHESVRIQKAAEPTFIVHGTTWTNSEIWENQRKYDEGTEERLLCVEAQARSMAAWRGRVQKQILNAR